MEPLGAAGGATISLTAAIANAIYDAVGVRPSGDKESVNASQLGLATFSHSEEVACSFLYVNTVEIDINLRSSYKRRKRGAPLVLTHIHKLNFALSRLLTFFTIVVTMMTLVPAASANEEDLVKKLIGTWEGTVAIKNNPFRILVISSVKREGDQWIAAGRWRTKEDARGMRVNIKIQVNGGEISLSFDAAKGDDLTLKLVGDRELTGMFNHAVARQRRNAQTSLKKVG
jgi:hypothetical protein